MTDGLKRIVTYTVLLGIFLVISTHGVMADGTEQLGTPLIPIANGSGIVLAGTGLETTQPGTISITVPDGTIKQVLLYWSGGAYNQSGGGPATGDNQITVVSNSVSNSVTGTLIGGPTWFFYWGYDVTGDVYFSTYRADITNLDIVKSGQTNTITISEMDFYNPSSNSENNGAGILVIYDDGSTSSLIQLRDGIDVAFINYWAERFSTVPQTFDFESASVDRVANLGMFFGSVSQNRPNSINVTVAVGGGTTVFSNLLESNNGPQWDTVNLVLPIPAGATSLTVQAFSRNDTGDGQKPLAASFTWSAAALSVPKPTASIGDRVWIDTNNDGIQDADELGYNGARVNLTDCSGNTLATTATNSSGNYLFSGLTPGNYSILFTLPGGYSFSPLDMGGVDAKDSDANTTTGITSCTVLAPGENDMTWDAGIYKMMAPGTGTPGYWKNHPEAWPVDSITIGGIPYNKSDAIAIMELSVKGDKTYTMFPALVAAKLNVMIGNDASCIADTISDADAWMKDHKVGTQVKGSSQAWKDGEPLYIKMDNYNNGLLCAPHRD